MILPVPRDSVQSQDLEYAISSFNPDYVLLPDDEISDSLAEMLKQMPSCPVKLTLEDIKHIGGITHDSGIPVITLNSFRRVEFPHIIRTLNSVYREPLSDSNFFTTDSSRFSGILPLQFGNPLPRYKEYMRDHLNAESVCINSIEALIKTSLLESVGVLKSAIFATSTEIISAEGSLFGGMVDHEKICNMFLHESNSVLVASSFWNLRRLRVGFSNKLVLPKEEFIKHLESCLQILSDFLPSMRNLTVHVETSIEEAKILADNVSTIFKSLNREICVEVNYKSLWFGHYSGAVYSSKPIAMTREVSLDKSIHFSPTPPEGYENSRCLFGYDAEVEFSSGNSLSLPSSQSTAVLLSNRLEQIEYEEQSKGYSNLDMLNNKLQPVRTRNRGISGVAIAGDECRVYLPESKEIISRLLKGLNLTFEPTDHTRYAQGFIKRFGGFEETRQLVSSGGTKIFVALGSERAKEKGFKQSQIADFLVLTFKLNKGEARKLVNENLPPLLAKELIYRGSSLKCPVCSLETWYKLESITEFVECIGCAESFQLQSLSTIEFAYKPNELAARFLGSDGQAVLATASFLSRIVPHRNIQMGGEIKSVGKSAAIAEIDLFILAREHLIISECKSYRCIDREKADGIIRHLERVVKLAAQIGAEAVVLGIVTTSIQCDLFTPISKIAEGAVDKGIGVHLLLNDEMYLRGQEETKVSKPHELSLNRLLVHEQTIRQDTSISVGKPIEEYRWEEQDKLINEDLIEPWKVELHIQ